MRAKPILTSVIAFGLACSAYADVTVDITGATAFRTATLDTIKARFVASGQPFKFAHDQAAGGFNGSNRAIFIGTFPGVTGTTTIRTSFNGSVEGIRALVNSPAADPTYLLPSVLDDVTATPAGAEKAATTTPVAAAQSEIAFSDVNIASTPLKGTLLPANAAAGVVTFTMIANEGAPASLTNVTTQQFKALLTNGFLPLSVFTGNAADTALVFATGRNDGSGTRTTYLAETGYGIAKTVQQFTVTTSSPDGLAITQIRRTRQNDGGTPQNPGANASIIWGNDVDGNGGYNSGSALRTDMAKTSANATVLDADGNTLLSNSQIHLITFLSTGDALTAANNGAKILSYNGVGITPTATGLSAADKAKVTNGQYTAWSYQQMYRRGDLTTGDVVTVYNGIKSNLAANLGASGIPIADMAVGRGEDGGPVAP